ncbi:uncharacterized protein MONOS_3078 [Monocercomonoides exilis]|uniref:uncharacterized protein n=1 Tax=Monocercomonoides exilis TaxID=2049356 RepID=UPI00355963E7|nr:hypothetical protein MONOS_3078 [Monocercomonoides exilis]|eukprot:MONOS_3078.1-p1 / transcript=MONOS_3078.1 / gene=MONOS_3078 / organism=Monocercomonoides_exilis_PA203 / gene_product=unspecified product / transcript_product=unspecified product / location=Mono_scaffold00069:25209-25492(-) / protein_length=77 / sequence_SO=supercontig / SO=protein_coding / is_pseudo=false
MCVSVASAKLLPRRGGEAEGGDEGAWQLSEELCLENRSLFCVCYSQTPKSLSLRIFRDACRLSGCCLSSFESVLEA